MDPLDFFPGELWFFISEFLDESSLLRLWKVNKYFNIMLLSSVFKRKRKSYGIDLICNPSQRTSLLTTYQLIDVSNNLLLPGKYHLKTDITCDTSEDDYFFIPFGEIEFHQNAKITLLKGNFFGLNSCTIKNTTFIFHLPNVKIIRKYSDDLGYIKINYHEPIEDKEDDNRQGYVFTTISGDNHIASCEINYFVYKQ